jgi:pyruvate ferredoxin oxidoreductase gamma subunit
MIEVRWHARAGQGAKTASQLLAMAELRTGRFVQAFPEYGPERGGAPMRAYTRIDDRPIRRRYGITNPDAVVVLDPSLLGESTVGEGAGDETLLLANGDRAADGLGADLAWPGRVICVPATRIALAHGPKSVNVAMVGALAGLLGHPPLDELLAADAELFGEKLSDKAAADVALAIRDGFESAEVEAAHV